MPTIPHAVYTAARGSGYAWTARSQSIQNNDGSLANAGVTDYLTNNRAQATDNNTYFSFFPLPGRRYLFTQRFISGRRSGANRVVAHVMLFTLDMLDAYHWDIIALLTTCNFNFDGNNCALTGLKEQIGREGLNGTIPDLSIFYNENDDFSRLSSQEFCSLQQHLRGYAEWSSKAQLTALLLGVFQALREQRTVVLPQGEQYEQAVIFIWRIK